MGQFQRIAADNATTMGPIKSRHLTEALCSVPSIRTLEALGEFTAPLVSRMVSDTLESRTLAKLRGTLLPELISGEVRVPAIEGSVEEVTA